MRVDTLCQNVDSAERLVDIASNQHLRSRPKAFPCAEVHRTPSTKVLEMYTKMFHVMPLLIGDCPFLESAVRSTAVRFTNFSTRGGVVRW